MSSTTGKPAKPKTLPITVFTETPEEARRLAEKDDNAKALTSGPGTLSFHSLIAAHGAGDFQTLYCPKEYRDRWARPVGGAVKCQT